MEIPKSYEVSAFIQTNANLPLSEVSLKLAKKGLPKEYILNQINGLQKIEKKIPTWFKVPDLIFPSPISLEQCSSEKAASFKAQLVKGKSMIDLTGGFGVDSYFFSISFEDVTLVEPQEKLIEITKHNFNLLKCNVTFSHSSAENFLASLSQKVNLVYIDPSRRDKLNSRVHQLEDCSPDVIKLLPKLLQYSEVVMIKAAPFLDIHQSLLKLGNCYKVVVLSIDNECKEVLYLIKDGNRIETEVQTINILKKETQSFTFRFSQEREALVAFSEPLTYLYEPNASILKAGAFKSICEEYQLKKLHVNSHLYTSHELIPSFPGKKFKISLTGAYQRNFRNNIEDKKTNVICRNFPEKPEQVRKKLKLNDGGSTFLFATRGLNEKPILILTQRVKS